VTIHWDEFLTVIVASLIAASLLVTLFSLALRFGVGEKRWSKPLSTTMYVLCGVLVAAGIFLIVPALHSVVLG
jgi:surface polysaccharide O-acyltransferase-like enzyme